MSTTHTTNEVNAADSAPGQEVTVSSAPTAVHLNGDVPRDLSFGAVVRHFRLARNMTQLQLSEALGHRTPEWAGMIEAGQRKINLDEVVQLACVLQLSPRDLGKLAVREQLPNLAAVLFGDRSGDGDVPRPAMGSGADLLPAAETLAGAWQALTQKNRQIVSATVAALMEAAGSDRRARTQKNRLRGKATPGPTRLADE